MTEQVSLRDYWDKLSRHDWYYNYSDDGSVWRRGEENESKLIAISRQSPEHKALYDGFKEHHFTGEGWTKKEKFPKPERPA